MLVNNMTQRRLDWAVQILAIRSWENKKYEYQWAKKSKTEFLISFNQYKTTIKSYSQIMCIITKTCQSTGIKKTFIWTMFMTKLLRQLNQFVSSFDNVSSLVTLSFFEAELMDGTQLFRSTSALLIDGQKVLWTSNVTN